MKSATTNFLMTLYAEVGVATVIKDFYDSAAKAWGTDLLAFAFYVVLFVAMTLLGGWWGVRAILRLINGTDYIEAPK